MTSPEAFLFATTTGTIAPTWPYMASAASAAAVYDLAPDEIRNLPVESFNFGIRASKAIRLSEIRTAGELALAGKGELMQWRGVGEGAINEIESALEKVGLRLLP